MRYFRESQYLEEREDCFNSICLTIGKVGAVIASIIIAVAIIKVCASIDGCIRVSEFHKIDNERQQTQIDYAIEARKYALTQYKRDWDSFPAVKE